MLGRRRILLMASRNAGLAALTAAGGAAIKLARWLITAGVLGLLGYAVAHEQLQGKPFRTHSAAFAVATWVLLLAVQRIWRRQ